MKSKRGRPPLLTERVYSFASGLNEPDEKDGNVGTEDVDDGFWDRLNEQKSQNAIKKAIDEFSEKLNNITEKFNIGYYELCDELRNKILNITMYIF